MAQGLSVEQSFRPRWFESTHRYHPFGRVEKFGISPRSDRGAWGFESPRGHHDSGVCLTVKTAAFEVADRGSIPCAGAIYTMRMVEILVQSRPRRHRIRPRVSLRRCRASAADRRRQGLRQRPDGDTGRERDDAHAPPRLRYPRPGHRQHQPHVYGECPTGRGSWLLTSRRVKTGLGFESPTLRHIITA